jgi:hypothetical protein
MTGAVSVAAAIGLRNPITLAENYAVDDTVFTPNSAFAAWSLESDGDIIQGTNAGNVDVGDWLSPKTGMSDFEVRVDNTSLEGSPINVWLNLGTTRGWFVQQIGSGSTAAGFTVEIRRASTGAVLDTAQVDLSAAVLD